MVNPMKYLISVIPKIPYFLRKWRVLKIAITAFLCIILWDVKEWIMEGPYENLDTGVQSVVISVIVAAIVTGLFTIANRMDEPHKMDEDEG